MLTFKTSCGMFHMVLKRRWLKSRPGAALLSRVSRDLTLGLYGLGYFRYAASAINSQGWLVGRGFIFKGSTYLTLYAVTTLPECVHIWPLLHSCQTLRPVLFPFQHRVGIGIRTRTLKKKKLVVIATKTRYKMAAEERSMPSSDPARVSCNWAAIGVKRSLIGI